MSTHPCSHTTNKKSPAHAMRRGTGQRAALQWNSALNDKSKPGRALGAVPGATADRGATHSRARTQGQNRSRAHAQHNALTLCAGVMATHCRAAANDLMAHRWRYATLRCGNEAAASGQISDQSSGRNTSSESRFPDSRRIVCASFGLGRFRPAMMLCKCIGAIPQRFANAFFSPSFASLKYSDQSIEAKNIPHRYFWQAPTIPAGIL